jgi:hypothetical protein
MVSKWWTEWTERQSGEEIRGIVEFMNETGNFLAVEAHNKMKREH